MTKSDINRYAELYFNRLCDSVLHQEFVVSKGKKLIKVTEDMLFFIELNIKKSGLSIWFGCFPLTEKNIWLGAAVLGGHYPEESLKPVLLEDESGNATLISDGAKFILNFFNSNSNTASVADNIPSEAKPYFLYTKAICLMSLGKVTESKDLLQNFLNSGLKGEQARYAKEMLFNIEEGTIEEYLAKAKQENLKKYA